MPLYKELQEKRVNDSAEALANTLNDISESVFSETRRIVYEFVQNADDASEKVDKDREVEFHVLGNYILICHNGKHFEEGDVRAICDYGVSKKQDDIEKTGYKGIGFKSVFKISNEVSIFSKNYKFKFDKNHWDQIVPWQLMPIAISKEEYPADVSKIIDDSKVSFLIKLKSTEEIEKVSKAFQTILKNYKIILFLRHVKLLSFYVQDEDRQIDPPVRQIRRTDLTEEKFKIVVADTNEESVTYWRLDSFVFDIPKEIRASVENEDEKICPKKLKDATKLEISLAAKLEEEDGKVIPINAGDGYLYSFLPTNIRRHYPFLVNATYLLDAERTHVLGHGDTNAPRNLWNEYLMKRIGYHQFEWYQRMQKDKTLKYEFPKLLMHYDRNTNDHLNKSFNIGVAKGQETFAFIPVLEKVTSQKIKNTIVDFTHISNDKSKMQLVKDSVASDVYIANPSIQKIETIIAYGANKFGIEELRDAIGRTSDFKNPEENSLLINFLFKRINELNGTDLSDWDKVLSETSFVLSTENQLKQAKELFFPEVMEALQFELSLQFVNETVYQDTISKNTPLREWLKKFGLANPTPIEIIRKEILPLIELQGVTLSNVVEITQFVFEYYQGLSSDELKYLGKKLPILTTEGNLLLPNKCHLSKGYHPILELESVVNEDIYVSERYLSQTTIDLQITGDMDMTDKKSDAFVEIQNWKKIFSTIGVKQEIEIQFFEGSYQFSHFTTDEQKEYLKYIKFPVYDWNKKHYIENQLYVPYLSAAKSNPDFAKKYWADLLGSQKWKELVDKSNKCKFIYSNGQQVIPTYFNFQIENTKCFPTTNDELNKTIDVYSNRLEPLLGAEAAISAIDMDPQQEDFLKIRNKLSLADCMSFLKELSENNSIEKDRIAAIYKYIIEQRFTNEQLGTISNYRDDFKLLSFNNTFQPKRELYYLNLPRFAARVDSPHFIFLNLIEKEAESLCKLLGIKTISKDVLKLQKEGGSLTKSPLENIWEKVLPFIALVSAKQKGVSFDIEHERLKELTKITSFAEFDELNLTYTNENMVEIYSIQIKAWCEDDKICYETPWTESRNKFDILEVIAQRFELDAVEKELSLFLDLNDKQILEWLGRYGYEIDTLKNFKSPKDEEEDVTVNKKPDETLINSLSKIKEVDVVTIVTEPDEPFENRAGSPIIDSTDPNDKFKSEDEDFINEVEDFINDLENTSWASHVQELKQLLLGIDQPEQKQKLHNLIAKIKLGLQIGSENDNTGNYNTLLEDEQKYIVHSARGPFAYIHPKEIREMHDNGAFMAIDWGAEKISIYRSAAELLNKNEVQLLRYSGDQSIEGLLSFCDDNKKEKRHLLFVDGGVEINKNKDILKILAPQDEY